MAEDVIDVSWYMWYGLLKRMYVLLLFSGVFYKFLLDYISFGVVEFFYIFAILLYRFFFSTMEKGVLKSSTLNVKLSFSF